MHKSLLTLCLAAFALTVPAVNGAELSNGESPKPKQESAPIFFVDKHTITPPMAMYLDAVRKKVQQNSSREWPLDTRGNKMPGAVVVRITLRKDGYIEQIQTEAVAERNDALSESVAQMVRGAQPFPPFPPSLFEGNELIAFGTTVGDSQGSGQKGGEPHFGAAGNNQRLELRTRVPF
jgi:TonB family protein